MRKAKTAKQTMHNLVAAGVLSPHEDVTQKNPACAKRRSQKSVGWRLSVKEISMRLCLHQTSLRGARFMPSPASRTAGNDG